MRTLLSFILFIKNNVWSNNNYVQIFYNIISFCKRKFLMRISIAESESVRTGTETTEAEL